MIYGIAPKKHKNLRRSVIEAGKQLGVKIQNEDIMTTHRLPTRSKSSNAIPPITVKFNDRDKAEV